MRCGRTASQSRSSPPAPRPSSGAWRTQPDGCARMERCGAERSQRVELQVEILDMKPGRTTALHAHDWSTVRVHQRACKTCKIRSFCCQSWQENVDDYGGVTEGRLCRNVSIASGGDS